jgi:leucyl aminopeptidase
MLQFQIVQEAKQRKTADIAILPYWGDEKKTVAAFSRKEFSEEFLSLMEKDFTAKPGESLLSYLPEGLEKRVLLLGLGKRKESDGDSLRKAYASALSVCRKKKLGHINLFVPQGLKEGEIEPILDGLWMANYSYDALKRKTVEENPTVLVKKVTLVGCSKDVQANLDKMHHVMDGVNLTRDLVNGNADDVKASFLVQMAKDLGKKFSAIDVKILGKKELEKEGMGLMLAVNRGASQDPALILMHYRGDPKSDDITAVVGKGVTYDTGGLNLKPTGSMETMKCDMAGSAAVAGLIQACASLKLKKNVLGVIASVENAIGGDAYKPGDVYISHSGKSIEISNTDAEGRLVLADAFSYVQKHFEVSRLIDFATLTGGVIVALGDEAAGLFSNDKKLCDQIKKAAEVVGERVWELPLYPEYLEALKSSIADLKNARNGRKASAGSGAMFLKQFVEKDLPWAHLDIAGTAYLSDLSAYSPSHATGVGVKLMIEFLQNL